MITFSVSFRRNLVRPPIIVVAHRAPRTPVQGQRTSWDVLYIKPRVYDDVRKDAAPPGGASSTIIGSDNLPT